jgi:hypothetical protein
LQSYVALKAMVTNSFRNIDPSFWRYSPVAADEYVDASLFRRIFASQQENGLGVLRLVSKSVVSVIVFSSSAGAFWNRRVPNRLEKSAPSALPRRCVP